MLEISRRFLLSSGLKSFCLSAFSFLLPTRVLSAEQKVLIKYFPSCVRSEKIQIQLPKIIVNSKQIPIAITHEIKDAQKLSIIIEKNPTPLLADFFIPQSTWLRTNLKSAESCWLYVVIQTQQHQSFYQKHWLTISENGCG